MKKKVLGFALSAIMAGSLLAGCGNTAATGNTSSASSAGASSSASQAASSESTGASSAASSAAADGTGLKIGCVFADLGNTSYVAMGKAMEEAAKARGAEFILKDTGNDSSTLVDVIENFIASGCNVIIEQNSDAEVTETVNQEALDAGIIILSFDNEMENASASYLASNYDLGYQIGTMCAEWANEQFEDGKCQIGLLNASSYDFILDRVEGIHAALAEKDPNCEIVIETDAVSTTDGLEAAENFLQAYPELNGVVGINDSVVLGAYEAFKGANRVGDDVGLFACDGSLEGLEAVAEGSIHRGTVSLHLNEVGVQMIEDGITLATGGILEETVNYFPLEAVTKDNVQSFLDALK